MLSAFILAADSTPAPEAAHSPVIPELPDLIYGTLAFLLVLAVVIWKVIPNVTKGLDARRDAIQGSLERAEQAQAEAAAALQDYTAQLAEARAEAAKIREAARADAGKIAAEVREQAQADAARIVANAQAQIEAERASALASLRTEVGTLALNLAGGVVGESLLDDKKASAVVDRFLAELEASQGASK